MLNKKTKLTALLVAAASVVSTMPAMAATRLGTKDGTVEKGIAFKDGKYLFQGYKDDDDDNGLYYNDGSKDKMLDDADEIDRKFDDKYVSALDGDDYYVVDMETGKITDDDTLEDLESEAQTKLANKLDDTDRYNSVKMNFESGNTGDYRLNRINDNRFEEVWYSYEVTSTSQAGQGSQFDKFGYTTQSGKYIDCSYDLNLYAYYSPTTGSAADGKMYKIEDIEDSKDASKAEASRKAENGFVENPNGSDKAPELKVTGLKFVKYLGQDDKYIYSLIQVSIQNAVDVGTNKLNDGPRYFIQKVTKEQGDKEDDAYKPKDTECFEVSSAFDNSDVKDAYDLIMKAKDYSIPEDEYDEKIEDKVRVSIVDGVLYVIHQDDDDVKVNKVVLKTSQKIDRRDADGDKNGKVSAHVAIKDGDEDTEAEYWTTDVDGNVWAIDDGDIKKSVKAGEFKTIYTCDRSLDRLDVYDENNLIAWEDGGDVYTNVSEGSAAAKEEAEQLVGPNENVAPQVKVGWNQLADGSWNLYDATGALVRGWANVGGTWYYMDPTTGSMRTGWVLEGGNWYYLNPVSDGYKGAMKTGWLNDNGTWYYLQPSGAMKTGWFLDTDGRWYYLYSSGAMATNTTIDGYYVGANGAWVR